MIGIIKTLYCDDNVFLTGQSVIILYLSLNIPSSGNQLIEKRFSLEFAGKIIMRILA